MKAIILAAGEGTRLRPLTSDKPKCMVSFHGKPLIDYQLEAMRQCGITDIVVVKGYLAQVLQREGVRFVLNSNYRNSNMVYSLFCAESEMTEDIIVSYGDILFGADILRALLESPADLAVTIDRNWRALWSMRMEDPLADAETLKLDGDGNITELGRKPGSYEDIQGQYMGLIKISKSVLEVIREFYHKLDRTRLYDGKDFDNMFMTSFIQSLIDAGFCVKAVEISGGWVEIDSLSDLELPLPV